MDRAGGMSLELFLLVAISVALAARGLIFPRSILEYPSAAGLLMVAFILPQAWAIERLGLAYGQSVQYSWIYMSFCLLMLAAGFIVGRRGVHLMSRPRRMNGHKPQRANRRVGLLGLTIDHLDRRKLLTACVVMCSLGALSQLQTWRLAEINDYGSGWSGIITFYYLLSTLLTMTFALCMLVYFKKGDRIFLVIGVIALAIILPTILVSVKRSWIFAVAAILLGGPFFVCRYTPPRLSLVLGFIAGVLLLQQVGQLREYVSDRDTTLVQAIAEGELTRNVAYFDMEKAPEVQGAVTTISVARRFQTYEPFQAMYNALISQYVPAFLVGKDLKKQLKTDSFIQEKRESVYEWGGATTTGFADSFSGYWWFGSVLFFVLSFFFGRVWRAAVGGSMSAQYFYLVTLPYGLIAITESISRFVSALPFIFVVACGVFQFSRKRTARTLRNGPTTLMRHRHQVRD